MPFKPNVRGEIRAAPRAVCAIPAIIMDRGVSIACTVEDLGINGCRARMNGHGRLSERFSFEFPKRGIRVDAELVWLNGEEAGIRFLHKKTGEEKPGGKTADTSSSNDQIEVG